ncbi:MAG: tetratricopeptide repeat protein, partial [Desulfovibrionaceae bacterium]
SGAGRIGGVQVYLAEAARRFEQALAVDPGFGPAREALGRLCLVLSEAAHQDNRRDEAEAWLSRHLELEPADAWARNNLAVVLQEMGRIPEAMASFRQALDLAPDSPVVHSNLLFGLHLDPAATARDRLDAARDYSARRPPDPDRRPGSSVLHADRPLRLGYVSADFGAHAVGAFILPLLEAHDPSQAQVIAFSNAPLEGDRLSRLQRAVAEVRFLHRLDDEAALSLLRETDLDLLVDLSGHTSGNRLPVLARRAAPIQAMWLGYFDTTGLEAMDYVLADERCCPPGAEAWFTETIMRLPHSFFCYTPPGHDPAPADKPPCLNQAPFTFACFNETAKLNGSVVAVWAEILHQAQGARLLLKSKGFADEAVRGRYRDLFAREGVDPARLLLEGPSPHAEYLAAHRRADLMLDPFPYNGGTVTCDALWMGVPTLCLAGESMAGRMGLSVLHAAGLASWACGSVQEYVHKAVEAASRPEELARLRQGQRERVLASPLCDREGFVADLMQAFRRMLDAKQRPSES